MENLAQDHSPVSEIMNGLQTLHSYESTLRRLYKMVHKLFVVFIAIGNSICDWGFIYVWDMFDYLHIKTIEM